MKLSIIVPVYNAENSIHILLDSILCSSKDFEVICVNDGSTDNSVSVIQNYEDSRVRVLTKINEGTFKTWQYGVKNSIGDYITILDQDDYIDKDYIDYIFQFIDSVKADILFTPYYVQMENGEKTICEIGIESGLYCGSELQKIRDKLLGGMVPYAKFTKVVKRELYEKQIKNTFNGQLRDYEDWLTMVEIFAMAESIYISNKAYYHYIQYANSVSKSTLSYKRNYESLMKVIEFLTHNTRNTIGDHNYNSFCFRALNIMLEKCLSIGEYNLAKKVISLDLFHNNVMHSNLSIIKKIIFYTKNIWLIKLYQRIRGTN